MLLDCCKGIEPKISLDALRFLHEIIRIPESEEQQLKGINAPTWVSVLVCPLVLFYLDSSVLGNRDSRFLFIIQTFGAVRRKFWVLRSWCASEKYQWLVKQFWSPLYCALHKHHLHTLKSVAILRWHGICLQFLCCSVMISHCLTGP